MPSVFKYLAFAGTLLLGACNEVDLPKPAESQPKIVLLGELVAGDSLQIRAGRSKAFSAAAHTIPAFEYNMQISASTAGGALALTAYEDDLLYSVYTTLFSNPGTVREGTEYLVKAATPGLAAVEATVSVPGAFRGTISSSPPIVRDGDSFFAFKVDMAALPAGSKYVIEVLSSPVEIRGTFFYDNEFRDLEQERRLYDSLIRAGEQIDVWRDTSYSELIERQPFFCDRSSSENTAPGAARSYYWFFLRPDGQSSVSLNVFVPTNARKRFPNSNLQLIVKLKSVAPDYYEFLKTYEMGSLQPADNKSLLIKPTSASGNVKGGYGVVGGVYLQEARFLY